MYNYNKSEMDKSIKNEIIMYNKSEMYINNNC